MTISAFPRTPSHLQKKDVQVLLRGGQSLHGTIHIPEGLPLLNFLGIKRFFLNLTSVRRTDQKSEETVFDHLSIRLSNVVWVIPMDGTLHITSALTPATTRRRVELQLVDGLSLTVSLNLAEEQRMSDYLDANSGFIPLWGAEFPSGSETIERLAVNHEAILAVREVPSA
jgi:hypothetical protein